MFSMRAAAEAAVGEFVALGELGQRGVAAFLRTKLTEADIYIFYGEPLPYMPLYSIFGGEDSGLRITTTLHISSGKRIYRLDERE